MVCFKVIFLLMLEISVLPFKAIEMKLPSQHFSLLCPLLVEGDLALGFGLSPQWTNSHLFVLISIKKTYLV